VVFVLLIPPEAISKKRPEAKADNTRPYRIREKHVSLAARAAE
jgi:hypothetical protein